MTFPLVGQKTQGVRTLFGTWVAPGANVTFLGPAGVFADTYTENNRVATLQAALARCRSGKGDTIFVLPTYTESINAADFATNLVAGTNIVGLASFGNSNMPTLNFTATTATILLDVADVTLSGLKFTTGIDGLAGMLSVSAAGCSILDCYFQLGTSSAQDMVGAAVTVLNGNDCRIAGCRFASQTTAVCTNAIAAGACDGLVIEDCDFDVQTSAATGGVIDISGAVTQFRIRKNTIVNRRATAAVAIRWSDTANTAGTISQNDLAFTADITAATAALSAAGSANHQVRAFDNLVHDENQGTAIPALITSAAAIE